MTWRVQTEDVELFRRELWKDERSFSRDVKVEPTEFVKDCFDERCARIELRAIEVLRSASGEPLCPSARLAAWFDLPMRFFARPKFYQFTAQNANSARLNRRELL